MESIPQKFTDGVRVKLKDGVHSTFYSGLGMAGNEGWVRAHKTDKFGYHRVYIEWDQDHWAYNGTPDSWTWEDHFELAGEPMSTRNDVIRELATRLIALADEQDEGDVPLDPFEDDEEEESAEPVSYQDTLDDAVQYARDADAFIVIAVNEEDLDDDNKALVPLAWHASHDLKSSLFCRMQLLELASRFQDGLIAERLGRTLMEDDD